MLACSSSRRMCPNAAARSSVRFFASRPRTKTLPTLPVSSSSRSAWRSFKFRSCAARSCCSVGTRIRSAKMSSTGCFPADKPPPRLKSLSLSRPSCAPCATAVSSARNGPSWISSARSLGLNCPPHGPRACGSLIASSRTASPARSLRSSGPSLCPGCSSSPAGPARGRFRAPNFKLTAAGCRSSTIAPHSASMAAASRGRNSSLPSIAPSPKRSSRPNRRTHQY